MDVIEPAAKCALHTKHILSNEGACGVPVPPNEALQLLERSHFPVRIHEPKHALHNLLPH